MYKISIWLQSHIDILSSSGSLPLWNPKFTPALYSYSRYLPNIEIVYFLSEVSEKLTKFWLKTPLFKQFYMLLLKHKQYFIKYTPFSENLKIVLCAVLFKVFM